MIDSVEKDIDVLAVGELNPDLLLTGLGGVPETGREIIAKDMALVLGSSTAITAAGTARLGLKTAMCSVVGDDDFGRRALLFLDEYGVDASHVRVDPRLRTGLTVSLSGSADRALVTYFGAIAEMLAEYIDDRLLARARHVHVGSFFLQEKLRPGLPALFAKARAAGATTSLDAGWDDTGVWDYGLAETLAHTDIFFPNESEAEAITGARNPEKAAEALACMCRIAVVKCGRQGAVLCGDARAMRGTQPMSVEMQPDDARTTIGLQPTNAEMQPDDARTMRGTQPSRVEIQPGDARAMRRTQPMSVEMQPGDARAMCDMQSIRAGAYLELKAIDTTGAGDSFNAGFIFGFLSGFDNEHCVRYGNACAGVSVTRIGGASGCATVADAENVIRYGNLL